MSAEGVLEHERHRHPQRKTESSPGATSVGALALYASIYEYLKLGRSTTPLQVDVPDSAEALHSSIPLRRWNRRDRTYPWCGHASKSVDRPLGNANPAPSTPHVAVRPAAHRREQARLSVPARSGRISTKWPVFAKFCVTSRAAAWYGVV